jgi:ATP-dependent exoDNAse (exonuclease V) alpha subunit
MPRRASRQGSEYPAVVIPVVTQHYTVLQRNLLYTGMTRGKRLVVLVGQKKAIASTSLPRSFVLVFAFSTTAG